MFIVIVSMWDGFWMKMNVQLNWNKIKIDFIKENATIIHTIYKRNKKEKLIIHNKKQIISKIKVIRLFTYWIQFSGWRCDWQTRFVNATFYAYNFTIIRKRFVSNDRYIKVMNICLKVALDVFNLMLFLTFLNQ